MKIVTVFLLACLPAYVFAESVVPIDKVSQHVNVRMSADATSEIVGRLRQGESAKLVQSTDGWHEIEIEGGATGFISADWTRVVAGDVPEEEAQVDTEAPGDATESALATTAVDELVEAPVAVEEAVEATVTDVEEAAEATVTDVVEEVVEPAKEDSEVAAAAEDAVEEIVTPEPETVAPPVVAETKSRSPIKGDRNFLVRFRDKNKGRNSQIYDDGNRIGIGTTTPKQRLEVNGSIQIHEQNSSVAGLMITQSSGETGYIMHNQASTLTIGAGSQDRLTIDRDGNAGFGVAKPKHPLEMVSGAFVTAGGVWTNSSSRERKENIVELNGDEALLALMQLQPVQFNYRNEVDEDYLGFIAEDVPALVAMRDRDSLNSMDVIAVLTRVVQEQQRQIDALEKRLNAAD